MKTIGILLIVIGAIGLVWGGASYIKSRDTTDIGPIHIVTEEKGHIPIPPVVGVVCLIAGGLMIGMSSRRVRSLTT